MSRTVGDNDALTSPSAMSFNTNSAEESECLCILCYLWHLCSLAS